MVKFNKKFFFNEGEKEVVKQTKTTKSKSKTKKKKNHNSLSFHLEKITYIFKRFLPIIIAILLLIIIILLIKGCTNNQNKTNTDNKKHQNDPIINDKVNKNLIDTINVGLNEEVPSIDKFIKNYDKLKGSDDSISYDDKNFVNNKYNEVGEYKVVIRIKGKEYYSRIIVIDSEAPILSLKDITITQGTNYNITDFITSCSDNSGKSCLYEYTNESYAKLTQVGTHEIGIVASDLSGNKSNEVKAKLIINAKQTVTPTPTKPTTPKKTETCEYGEVVNKNNIPLAVKAPTKCALDIEIAKKDNDYVRKADQMCVTDKEQLNKDLGAKGYSQYNYEKTIKPILLESKKGFIGYAAIITAKVDNKVTSYYINENGSRTYITNNLGI